MGAQLLGNPNASAGAGLPNPVPADYTGDVYLVPNNGNWETVIYSSMAKSDETNYNFFINNTSFIRIL